MHAEEIIRSANYLMDDLSKVLGEASGAIFDLHKLRKIS